MDRKAYVYAAVTVIVWSSAYAGIRVGLTSYDPGALALMRFLVASAVMGVVALFLGLPRPRAVDVPRFLAGGLLGIAFYHSALNFGEIRIAAGTASILIAFAPVIMAILASLFLRERITGLAWVGVALGFVGVVLIAVGGGQPLDWKLSAGVILLCAIATSILFIIEKPLFERYSTFAVTAFVTWSGTLFLLVFSPSLVRDAASASAAATWSGIYIGVFPAAVGYLAWNAALSRAPASRMGTWLYGVPAMAVLISWLWLGEVPGSWAIGGGALVVAGVALVNAARRTPARQSTGFAKDASTELAD